MHPVRPTDIETPAPIGVWGKERSIAGHTSEPPHVTGCKGLYLGLLLVIKGCLQAYVKLYLGLDRRSVTEAALSRGPTIS